MFFLRPHVDLPKTFEAIARYILGRIVSCEGDTNHFVCDKWIEPPIKDCEREHRGSLRGVYSIKDPAQIRPSDWGVALKNKNFKERLLGFWIEPGKDDSCAGILKNKTVYANHKNCCCKHRVENGLAIATEEEQFFRTHERAGIRMFFSHLNQVLPGSSVVMRTDNTSSLVIALGWKHFSIL